MIQTHNVLASLATPVDVIEGDLGVTKYVLRTIVQSTVRLDSAHVVIRRDGLVVLDETLPVLAMAGQESTINTVATPAFDGLVGDHLQIAIKPVGSEDFITTELTLSPVKGKRRQMDHQPAAAKFELAS